MKSFNFYQPTRLLFGSGRRVDAGAAARDLADSALFVVDPMLLTVAADKVEDVQRSLGEAGVRVVTSTDVVPNPTLDAIQRGAELAKGEGVKAVIGMGGGSAIDTAKAIAVAARHPGTAWDYLYFKKAPTAATLPIMAINTTSGTGTQTSKVSVFTNTAETCKSAICDDNLLCRVAIIDPELMLSLPAHVTAATGFDIFTHTFESYINTGACEAVDAIALDAIARVLRSLPVAVTNGSNLSAREDLAWADTLAGQCLANVGTTLPHAAGQPISGHFPKVSHGESLAVIYPAFAAFTWRGAVSKFARVARMFNPALATASDEVAAQSLALEVERFLKLIGLYRRLDDFGITSNDIPPILAHAMEFPDNQGNPVVPSQEDMRQIYMKSFRNA
ncbi:iron-containing alcohol dehydrogenase [Roseospira visakhapatnamensis]|uniref:Alcohol dehydrogenase class IV n=1 Tax=Roseospira visakhapatnamensis TaxID=390880 RepID=A0A7W6RGD6_9PROT|nr:iron-containing alcohol dehydrogenase [Roseospira visakhapatnamensis]MBB4267952.1 alcohol dehydrogenase class IV [Roseospira visakhapatnamensis]